MVSKFVTTPKMMIQIIPIYQCASSISKCKEKKLLHLFSFVRQLKAFTVMLFGEVKKYLGFPISPLFEDSIHIQFPFIPYLLSNTRLSQAHVGAPPLACVIAFLFLSHRRFSVACVATHASANEVESNI
jgi:hypothetical protein